MSEGIIGVNPPVSRRTAATFATSVDSTAKVPAGTVVWFREESGGISRVSAVKYYKAAASVRLGAALKQDTGARNPNQLAETATTDAKQDYCRGISAAAVSNTGYFAWAYVAGYCPEAHMPTSYASNQIFMLSGTEAGKLTSAYNHATLGNSTGMGKSVFWSFSVASGSNGGSTSSGVIIGWLG